MIYEKEVKIKSEHPRGDVHMDSWPSGEVGDCKSLYIGSNPILSSIKYEVMKFLKEWLKLNTRPITWWVILIWTFVFWSFVFRLVGLI